MAATQTATDVIEVICTCGICRDNAARLGVETLGARVPRVFYDQCKPTPKGRHGLVHLANDPNDLTGEMTRRNTGVSPLIETPRQAKRNTTYRLWLEWRYGVESHTDLRGIGVPPSRAFREYRAETGLSL